MGFTRLQLVQTAAGTDASDEAPCAWGALGRWAALDFETTRKRAGMPPVPTEVALLCFEGAQEVSKLWWRSSRPGCSAGLPTDILRFLQSRLEQCTFVAAHNAGFDREVLLRALAAEGLPLLPIPFLCTMRLASRLWPGPKLSLSVLCQELGIDLPAPHRAAPDARAAAALVLRAWEEGGGFELRDFLRPQRRRVSQNLVRRNGPGTRRSHR